ncbi:MAG TPA: DUF1800 domain-containing protein [Xanthobacteraceae bacterium]|nr:DUF1800 domain-containing protein [Xanthobacteraceae bacterium]
MRRVRERYRGVGAVLVTALAAGLIAAPTIGYGGPEKDSHWVALTPQQLNLLNRVTFGANPSSARALASLGPERFLERQLHPPPSDTLPPEAQAQIDALSLGRQSLEEIVGEADQQQKAVNAITDPELKQAAQRVYQERLNRLGREAATRALLRDLYAASQLREQLAWFWFNHFNVHLHKANIRALVGDYEEKALRPHVLGRFRDLLRATLRHPAMLRYLDNDQNAAGHINENYAREIMELHTMGVGSGYTQGDVQELARILTGVGVVNPSNPPKVKPELASQYVREGLFEFNPNRHDYGDKTFLGHEINGSGLNEVEQALDLLCHSGATARFVSRKLALYFVSDNPPQPLIDAMAETFRATDGDIAAVLKTMFQSPHFNASLGARFKDPVHFVISALRLAYDDKVVVNVNPIQGWIGRLAEPLYAHETPDGYSLNDNAWNSSGQMATRFEIARAIGANSAGLFRTDGPPPAEQPAFPLIANALYFSSIQPTLAEPTQKALSLATSPQEWNGLFLSSPEFMRR